MVCLGTLPATLRLSYASTIVLITDLFARLRHKVIPHGSTASNELASDILVEAASAQKVGSYPVSGHYKIKITQIGFANPLWLFLYRGARASAAQALDGLRSCAVVSG